MTDEGHEGAKVACVAMLNYFISSDVPSLDEKAERRKAKLEEGMTRWRQVALEGGRWDCREEGVLDGRKWDWTEEGEVLYLQ